MTTQNDSIGFWPRRHARTGPAQVAKYPTRNASKEYLSPGWRRRALTEVKPPIDPGPNVFLTLCDVTSDKEWGGTRSW